MSEISTEWKELRQKIGNFICRMDGVNAQINAKVKKLQEKEEQQTDLQAKIDEAYNKGLEDARNAVLQLYGNKNRHEIFGSYYNFYILNNYSMAEIIEKENQLKAEKDKKEQELHVGDEIEYTSRYTQGEKRIIIGIKDGMDDGEKIIWSIDVELTGHRFWFFSTDKDVEYRKTGKHYDSIPLPKEIK